MEEFKRLIAKTEACEIFAMKPHQFDKLKHRHNIKPMSKQGNKALYLYADVAMAINAT